MAATESKNSSSNNHNNNHNNGNKVSPLEVESLTGSDSLDAQYADEDPVPFVMPNIFNLLQNLWTLFITHMSYYRRFTFPLAAIMVILGIVLVLDEIAYSTTTQRHVASVSHDYANSHSTYELKMQQIDHWCLSGGDDDCRCDDPTIAMPKGEVNGWTRAHKKNKELVADYNFMSTVELVMVGDQATEEWNGRLLGSLADDYKGTNTYFKNTFTRNGGGNLDAVALGIAGDSITNLLWRLQHGEMPDALVPKVWWIQIGGNDLAQGQCSEEATLLGILRLAEYISTKRPGSIVVINSILPSLEEMKPRIKHANFKAFDLFPSIQVVNEQLEKFAKNNNEFEFYDATDLFFTSPPVKPSQNTKKSKHLPSLDPQFMDENGKVTNAGHKKWGKAIVDEVTRIMYNSMYEEGQDELMDDMFLDDFLLN